jgi:hypothetical protein
MHGIMHLYRRSTRKDSPFSRHFFEAIMMVHLSVTRIRIDPALPVRIRDLNRRFDGLQVFPRLRFACCRRRSSYRGASCLVMWMTRSLGCQRSPSGFGDGRGPLGGNLGWKPGCRASLSSERLWSGYVMLLALVSGIKDLGRAAPRQAASASQCTAAGTAES